MTSRDKRSWLALGLIFLLALALRVAYLASYAKSPSAAALIGDAETFDAWAQEIARGNWLGKGAYFQAPLYPYLLGVLYAWVGRSLLVVEVLQAVLGALSCVLVSDAVARSFGRGVGILAGVMLALYAPAIYYAALLEKSALTLFELALLVHTLARCQERTSASRLFLVGLILGSIVLTRENGAVLIFAIVPWIWRSNHGESARRKVGWSWALVAGLLVLLLPVTIRNRIVIGEFILTTTNFGSNLYIGNHAGADGLYTPLRVGRGHSRYENVDATEIAEANVGRGELSNAEVSNYWRDTALAWISEHPSAWLALTARKLAYLCNDREWMDSQSYLVARAENSVLRYLGTLARWGTLFSLALLGLCLAWSRRRSLALWYSSIPLLASGIALFWIFGRFRISLIVFLLPFAALALLWIIDRARERAVGKLFGASAVLAIGAAIAFWPVPSDLELPVADTFTNLGSALLRSGHASDARACFERARDDRPDYANPYLGLGTIDSIDGDVNGAIRNLTRAAELEPALAAYCHLLLAQLHQRLEHVPEAQVELRAAVQAGVSTAEDYYRIGLIQRQLGNLAEARAAYQRALELRPSFVDAHNNLGYLLANSGFEREALIHYERALALDPDYARAMINLGWLRLRSVDPTLHDIGQARDLARRAGEVLGLDEPGVRELRDAALADRKN